MATLQPVTVTATRVAEPVSTLPFTVDTLDSDAISDSPSLTVDDALRGSPDFSLFRRNDSLTANPTTQGVSLRGLGPSGASRSLVLLDGVPLNDPFGGWIPWSSILPLSVSRAEIIPGGGASAWGNETLAGVVQLFTRRPSAGSGSLQAEAGEFGTFIGSLEQSLAFAGGALDVGAGAFRTAGEILVAPESRGPVDIDAASRHNAETARWRGNLGRSVAAALSLRHFDEWRDNGTAYQQNRIRSTTASATLDGSVGADETWNLTAYGEGQDASQSFSSVNATRTSEAPASDQFAVPATAVGLAGTLSWTDSGLGRTTVGADLRDLAGETREDFSYSKGSYTEQRFAGGRQVFGGVFVERTQPVGDRLHLTAGARIDRWENIDGHMRTTNASTGALLVQDLYPLRLGTELSPSLGAVLALSPGISLHANAQHAFREPTLNELYRPFRQGNTTTLANAGLATEHADTAEAGASLERGNLKITATGFAGRLENPVDNVTLAQGPGTFPLFGTLAAGSTGQERLNLGRIDTLGIQASASVSLPAGLSLEAAVVDENASVASAPVAPLLVGKSPAEVPHWGGSAGVRWRPAPRLSLDVRVRWTGAQFDDDLNTLVLASSCQADASARFALSENASLFAAVDNLADARIETAHSSLGVFNLAPGRTVRGGIRLAW